MKKTLYILGVAFVVLILAAGALIGYMATVGPRLDASSKMFVDQEVQANIATWSVDELMSKGSASFCDSVNIEQAHALFAKLSTLGKLVRYEGSKGESNINFSPKGKVVTAAYRAKATFENGEATFDVSLLQVSGQWQIYGFHVDSPVMLR